MNRMTSTTFEQFLETPGNQRIYEQERLLVDATELLSTAMETTGAKRGDLAQRLGCSKAYITQILRGNKNLTLRTLADVFWALNHRVVLRSLPLANTECGSIVSGNWDLIQRTGNRPLSKAEACEEAPDQMSKEAAWAA